MPDHFLTIEVGEAKSNAMFALNGSHVSLLVAPIRSSAATAVRLSSMPLGDGEGPGVALSKTDAWVTARENQRC